MVKNKSGTSLIEIMMAFGIMVVSILAISGLISYGHRGTEKDFRNVQAIQVLEEKMNRLLTASFAKISAEVMAGANKVTVNKVLFPGTVHQIVFGKTTIEKTTFDVFADLEKIAVSFEVRPLEIDNSYEFAKVQTYKFGALTSALARFDGSNTGKNRYRVIRVFIRVKWVEPVVNVARQVEALSYMVDLEG